MAGSTSPPGCNAPIAKDFIQNDPKEGEPATFDTEVRLLYDDDALYIGVFAKDETPSGIIINELRKDFNTGSGDSFQVVIDTFQDERNGYQFAINPAGAKWDSQMSNEGRDQNSNWDGVWDVGTRIAEDGWYAEIRIPFRTLKFTQASQQTWGINFQRRLRRLNENSYWSPLPRIHQLSRVSMAGTLENLQGLRPGNNLRVKPYALASASRVRQRLDERRLRLRRRREVRRHVRADVGLHLQHRLLTGRSRRAAGQPDALQPVLSGEARLLPRELRHLSVRRRQVAAAVAVAAAAAAAVRTRRRT